MGMWAVFFLVVTSAAAAAPDVLTARFQAEEVALTADPEARHWKSALPVVAERGPRGEPTGGHRTEIRALWTRQHLYFLFSCPYQALFLKGEPSTAMETNRLWEWDVAEVFLGGDFENIHRYREFQVSPQGEWVDLDIDRLRPLPEGGWRWNSGFTVKARIDHARKIWYGEMRIPLASINGGPPAKGREYRVNLYRIQGPPARRIFIAWQPTGNPSYHVPEAFGRLRLE